MKRLFQIIAFVLIFCIGAVLPLVGGLLFVIFQALGLTDVEL